MPADTKPAGGSPFEIVTPGKSKRPGKTGIIVGVVIVIFLILSVVAGVLLVRQQQNVQEKAAATCTEQCPGKDGVLRNCTPPEADGSAAESTCNLAGRIEVCGGAQFCCPAASGVWTTNMSSCAVASPTETPTATSTAAPTASASATPTLTPTPTETSISTGNTCNGTCGSNSNCQSGLYCYSGSCRNPLCASDSTCGCSSATGTPTATPTAAAGATSGTTTQTTPLPIPVTGTGWPTYLGISAGAIIIIISLLLAI